MATKRKTVGAQIPAGDMASAETLAMSARYNETVLAIARLIGRQIAREEFEQQASAQNAPVARADKMR